MDKAFLPVGKAEVTSSILVISSCPKPEQVSGFFFTPKYFRLFIVMCKWAAAQHSKPSTDFTLPEVNGTYTPMELPEPVEMVFYTENTDVKTVLEDYEQLIEDCEEFFGKYDIEDCDDPEGRDEYEKLSGYHSALEEVWEDWDLGTP